MFIYDRWNHQIWDVTRSSKPLSCFQWKTISIKTTYFYFLLCNRSVFRLFTAAISIHLAGAGKGVAGQAWGEGGCHVTVLNDCHGCTQLHLDVASRTDGRRNLQCQLALELRRYLLWLFVLCVKCLYGMELHLHMCICVWRKVYAVYGRYCFPVEKNVVFLGSPFSVYAHIRHSLHITRRRRRKICNYNLKAKYLPTILY